MPPKPTKSSAKTRRKPADRGPARRNNQESGSSADKILPAALRAFFDEIGSSRPIHVIQRVRYPDGRLRYTYASESWAKLLGAGVVERILAQATADHSFVHQDDRGRLVAAIHSSAAQLTVLDTHVRLLNRDGGITWVRSFARPRKLADGTVVWDGIAIDITEHYLAMEAIDRAVDQTRSRDDGYVQELLVTAEGLLTKLGDVYALVGNTKAASNKAPPRSLRAADALRDLQALERSLRRLVEEGRGGAKGGAVHPVHALTARQREILQLVSQGHDNRAIAAQLGISEGTVKLHLSALFKRLGVRNRIQAARLMGASI
ncbi:DNA-binding NarL/FixJ family response regulator [Rhodopseudomonas rhenobacensis]|uniref:DNA-binding NarL/FixJ family response regulator n=1 Tax=Rhodopseudomonas rhenobacensis TaxID=87461 RepID=A0A7W7Z4W7_9BRAD|nr:LuxR C-terminal-related transcriptional regulator [Rhodopseudomonas rhenobacensis]MBB5048070.1 DNA-binding NarL/FixJ family response regulator [Rhodopseudomonas rhenobacensis]